MKGPVLVVLAAGIGSRYGSLKQMEKIGKTGEVLLDYSVYDALLSGFKKVVFIIRHEIERDFAERILARISSSIKWELAFQEQNSLIPPDIFSAAQKAGRTKPWGTAHALLCAAEQIDAPFVVVNADDFYGREAFMVMAEHLNASYPPESAIVPYRLEKTLSLRGTVARGVCTIKDEYLVSVNELTAIEKKDGQIFNTNADNSVSFLAADTPVSMNFWGLPGNVIPEIKKYFDIFLDSFEKDIPGRIKSECYLSTAADFLLKKNIIKIRALQANSDWFGVTYQEDRQLAVNKIAELISQGKYPKALW